MEHPPEAIRVLVFFFSSRRRHTRFDCDWSSDVCSSDLYSDWEGFGLVIIEAMAGGTPCIVSNKGSLPHLVKNNYNGFIVNDVLELKQRILELTQDKDLRNILSRNSKEFAKK